MIILSLATMALVSGSANQKWDWNIIIGTGQSLSVGALGMPIKSTEQPYGNLKVSSADLTWPMDPNDPKFSLVPLVEPVGRHTVGYPNSWPTNIDGETPHASAANQISALALEKLHRDHTTVHFAVGEAGQGMIYIRKNPEPHKVSGHAFQASLLQTQVVTRLAKAAGKTVGVGAIFLTHGETDTGNQKYEQEEFQLWADYNQDLKAITGQKQDVLLITSQHNRLGEHSPSTQAEWKGGVDHPDQIVCSGPKYQYQYAGDALHLNTDGYRLLGEKYGQVYFERVVLGHKWRPLEPTKVTAKGTVLEVKFHVPVKPLVWDSTLGNPHPSSPEWKDGKGFEVTDATGKKITIVSAELKGGDTVVLTLASDPGAGARLSYAMVGEPTMSHPPYGASPHWGNLRDSDPFVGTNTHQPQPNFCVAFDWNL